MLSAGQLIWASCRPLIRLFICAGSGYVITKADIFPPVAARGAGQIMLNIALPCLMASKIIPAFQSDNIKALGPLVLVAILYEMIGVLIAWVVKQVFWVPHRFRFGILVAGGWGNYGDIPTSVVMSITGSAPFNGSSDQTLAVAYISAFILVFFITLFPLGAHHWVAMDYAGPDVENDEVQEALRLKWKTLFNGGWLRPASKFIHAFGLHPQATSEAKREKSTGIESPMAEVEKGVILSMRPNQSEDCTTSSRPSQQCTPGQSKNVSFYRDETTTAVATETVMSPTGSLDVGALPKVTSPVPTVTPVDTMALSPTENDNLYETLAPQSQTPTSKKRRHRAANMTITFVRSLLKPASLSILISFIISLVPTLKALFVPDVPGTHIPTAPDGLPPLYFLIDTASFIGAASVPLGLICLGSALARLKVPRGQWGQLPLGAIGGLAVGKILIMPVLGVLICQGLTNLGVIDKEDKVLRFVCIFFSCLPTATTQVFLTQIYSGTGAAEHLSAFLIPQYILMFISMTAVTAYTLQSLF